MNMLADLPMIKKTHKVLYLGGILLVVGVLAWFLS